MSNSRIEELRKLFRYNPKTGSLIKRSTRKKIGGMNVDPKTKTKYLRTIFRNRKTANHVLIWAIQTGEWPKNVIDHIDGNGLNNRWTNLREVTQKENRKNCRLDSRNTSGIPGVSMMGNRWRVRIEGKYIGLFKCIFEAACARKSAERKYGYHLNHGRTA